MRGWAMSTWTCAGPCAVAGAAYQERLASHGQRPDRGVPAPVLDKQVLPRLEAEQGQCREGPALAVEAEQDGVFGRQPPEFRRHGQ